MDNINEVVSFLIISVSLIIAAVPEGLPLAVTISLAFSVMQMKKENNLVRQLSASETMGGAHEICTDKTGTLTLNQMTVKQVYVNDEIIDAHPGSLNFMGADSAEILTECVLYNISARVEHDTESGKWVTKGNCTERGLLHYFMDCNSPVADIIKQKDGNIVEVIPFNSGRKRATTALKHPSKDIVRVFCKGAPEIVINYCDSYFVQGEQKPLSADKKTEILTKIVKESFAPKAYRTLLVAYADLSYDEYESLKNANNMFKKEKDRECLESKLCVAGIFALQDPLRPEIVGSAQTCFKAGINIRMVTGDNIDTATAIAIEAGILKREDKGKEFVCMEGQKFREEIGGLKRIEDPNDNSGRLREEIGNKSAFRQIAKNLKVLARSTPEDKYMLVTGLKELNNVVAVTGDGTNDAPALKKADVGFAMGITGTEVAKEASDIILLDDNFASIITAVRWGRNIYTNVRKFLQF